MATAIVVAGAFSILGAVLYRPAIRQERLLAAQPLVSVDAG